MGKFKLTAMLLGNVAVKNTYDYMYCECSSKVVKKKKVILL